ncbi:glycosyltransferase family 39 protein [Synechococcus sp. GFB01]|uniref:ArnT family glycosyltransferase n=1 Tax=Synechococcus sp. GFB01 TaxID=1662190 RepID=UPI00064ED0D6|nr:glycosyltransferase family 39 protein [Synechococcus sp. GFB01]KMM17494.1 hypothetical protein SYNGFB01_03845 [Synechococcus sp. GFB01]
MHQEHRRKALHHPSTRLWLGITLYLIVFAALRIALNSTISFDDAEQVLLSQDWRLGYGDQPPLYTYLTKLGFAALGPSQTALAILKVGLLSSCVGGLLLLSRELKLRADQTIIAISSYALIPQFIWTSQTSLSHSVLATTMGIFLLLVLVRTERQPSVLNFLLLGILAAAGLLSKYNFLILIGTLIATGLTIERFRAVYLNPRILLSLGTTSALVAPHLQWCLANASDSLYGWTDYEVMRLPFWAWPLSGFVMAMVFLSPYWLGFSVLAWPHRHELKIANPTRHPARALLQRLPLAMAATMLLVIVLVTQEKVIRVHWFHSLLFYVPLSAATLLPPLEKRRLKGFASLSMIAALAALIALPAQMASSTLIPRHQKKKLAPSISELTAAIAAITTPSAAIDVIVTSNIKVAANARLAFPRARVIRLAKEHPAGNSVADRHASDSGSRGQFHGAQGVLLLFDSPVAPEVSSRLLKAFALRDRGLPKLDFNRHVIQHPSGRDIILYYSWFPGARPTRPDRNSRPRSGSTHPG